MREDAPNRAHPLRAVFNGLRYVVRGGEQWRMMPNDLPPWYTVYQQTQRWLAAGVFEQLVHDLRMLLREIDGRNPSRALRSSMAGRCNRLRRAVHERVMTVTRNAKGRKCIWPLIRWVNCWRSS